MAFGKKNENVLRRSLPPWVVEPTEAQLDVLQHISGNLWLVNTEALTKRQDAFNTCLAPLYQGRKEAYEAQDAARVNEYSHRIKKAFEERMPDLADQINALTTRRAKDPLFANVPRNWQEEAVKTLDAGYRSFMKLRARGDRDARPPRVRSEWAFHELRGRAGFRVIERSKVVLSCKLAGDIELIFPIPKHQQGLLARPALAVKEFKLCRIPADTRREGTFWLSLAYEVPKPSQVPFVAEEAVYIVPGHWHLGVISSTGKESVELLRPDENWKPKIDEVEARLVACSKGSRTYRKRLAARNRMYRLMSEQQKKNHREVVDHRLLSLGKHFVVLDLVVRSKKGKLADAQNPTWGGALGHNWRSQNTGSLGRVVQWLETKAPEYGGSVRKHRLQGLSPEEMLFVPPDFSVVRQLKQDFLANFNKQ